MPGLSKEKLYRRLEIFKDRDIQMISNYEGSNKKHEFMCIKTGCRHNWKDTFNHISNGRGCPKCLGYFIGEDSIQKGLEDLKLRSITLVSDYQRRLKKHKFQCLKTSCKYIWDATWSSVVVSKTGCPRCAGKVMTEDEKSAGVYRKMIRTRISSLYRRGTLNVSVHRNGDYMAEILNYCKTEFNKIPQKPDDNQSWHLDHIIPVSKFDHSDLDQIKICWDARNLQWLPSKVNEAKRNKLVSQYFTDWHYEVVNRLEMT